MENEINTVRCKRCNKDSKMIADVELRQNKWQLWDVLPEIWLCQNCDVECRKLHRDVNKEISQMKEDVVGDPLNYEQWARLLREKILREERKIVLPSLEHIRDIVCIESRGRTSQDKLHEIKAIVLSVLYPQEDQE